MKIEKPRKTFGEALYDLLPRRYRETRKAAQVHATQEHHQIYPPALIQEDKLEPLTLRFLRTFGDLYDVLIGSIEQLYDYWFPATCPRTALSHLASNLGFPLPGNIDEETARLLLYSIRTIYQYSSTEYVIKFFARVVAKTDVIVHSNPKSGMLSQVGTYLSVEYAGGVELTLESTVGLRENDLITVYLGDLWGTVYIEEINGDSVIVNQPLPYFFPRYAHVTTGAYSNLFKPSGLAGFVGIYSDTGYSDVLPTDATLTDAEASDIYTLWVEWHHVPDFANLQTVIDVMEYFAPGRFEMKHIFRSHSNFVSDINVSDGYERTG